MDQKYEEKIVWQDRKRTIFGLPWTFTVYTLNEDALVIRTGFLNQKEEQIKLYRILDMSLTRSLGQRMFGLGTIHVCSNDTTAPEFDIKNIKDVRSVKAALSKLVDEQRKAHGIQEIQLGNNNGSAHIQQ